MSLTLFYSGDRDLTRWVAVVSTATILTIAGNTPGVAQTRLLVTEISSGDCVAANISTVKTAAHQALDRQYCTEKNPVSLQKTQCQKNLAQSAPVTFFTDRCTNKNYAIGLNGVEYSLKRMSGKSVPPYLTGLFVGSGIRCDVKQIGSIEQSNDDGVPSGKVEVLVTITQGKKTEKITGLLVYGP